MIPRFDYDANLAAVEAWLATDHESVQATEDLAGAIARDLLHLQEGDVNDRAAAAYALMHLGTWLSIAVVREQWTPAILANLVLCTARALDPEVGIPSTPGAPA